MLQKKLTISFFILATAAILALMVSPLNMLLAITLGILIIIASYGCFFFQKKISLAYQQEIITIEQSSTQNRDNTHIEQYLDLAPKIIKVWAAQTALARGQGDEHINQITRNFAQIKTQLAQVNVQLPSTLHKSQDHAEQAMLPSSSPLAQESAIVAKAIDEILVSLQFQDSVSQILGHVIDDMNKLAPSYQECQYNFSQGSPIEPIDSNQWLNNIKQTYTTAEQIAVHDGNEPTHGDEQKNNKDGLTFF